MKKKISIVMGSQSDYKTMKFCEKVLKILKIKYETKIISAHRTPQRMYNYASKAEKNNIGVIIAGAGGAAHLPGMISALTHLPVLGVPVESKKLYLSQKNVDKLSERSESKFTNRIFSYYEASKNGKRVYTAYLITHRLRTRTQTLFIVFKANGEMKSAEVIAFYEPEEYIMTQPWLKQFNNKKVNNMPTQNEVIRVSNSTISYNETTKAIRRIANVNSFIYD